MGLPPGAAGNPFLTDPVPARLRELEKRLGLRFRNQALLRQAVTHRSYINEAPGATVDNERLEYLGDAVLELIAAEHLYSRFPEASEGEMTRRRAAMVNSATLARLADEIRLGETIVLGRGVEQLGGRGMRSVLANAFEAVMGAVYLDRGYRSARDLFLKILAYEVDIPDGNHKGALQELAQVHLGRTPRYSILAATGPGHDRTFTARVEVGEELSAEGQGSNKQEAEQEAARAALAILLPAAGLALDRPQDLVSDSASDH